MSEVGIKIVTVGILETNCYILADKEGAIGIVVDPGDEFERIASVIEEAGLNIQYIVNTHAHYDHIGADLELKDRFGAQILIHEADRDMLEDPRLNLSLKKPRITATGIKADRLLKEGDIVTAEKIHLEVIHTPGHTPGSICLLGEDYILTGDTLFAGSAGRTDLPGGSYKDIVESIQGKLKPLPDYLKVYPGHGLSSTMGEEKLNNPFL